MTNKRKTVYESIIVGLSIILMALCAYMGITAVQKSMRLNVGFSAVPSIKVLIQIEDPQADGGYRTIFRNDANTQIGAGLEIHGNTLQFTNSFADSEPNIGASFVLKFTNLMTNTGLKASVIGNSATANPTYVIMKESGSGQDTATMTVSGSSDLATLKLSFVEYHFYSVAVASTTNNYEFSGASDVAENTEYTASIKAKAGYNLSITVTRNDGTTTTLTEGQGYDYVWDSSTGALTIYAKAVTGDITINCLDNNAISYTISYNLDGGSVATANPTAYTVEDTFTLTNPTKTGYNFAGWTGTGLNGAIQSVTISQMTGNRSYTATWTIINYTITYNLNGGSVATANPTAYTVESNAFTLTNPTKTGYNFAGWTGTGLSSATKTVTISQMTGNRSYTATWTIIEYSISYTLNSGTNHASNPTKYTVESASITLQAPTRDGGYMFGGWTGSNGSTAQTSVTIPQGSTGNKTYTANWTVGNYTLMKGQDLNAKIKQTAKNNTTSTYSASDTTIKTIIFGKYSTYASTVGAWGGGIVVDSNSAGNIRMFLTNSKANCYILSDGNIYANPESTASKSYNRMFYNFEGVTSITFNNFNTTNVTNMGQMFYSCTNLTNLTLGNNFNTSKVINMSNMFQECSSLASLDLSSFNTSNVTDMFRMFYECSNLTNLTLSNNFNASNVTNMGQMFRDCSNLTSLNLSSFNPTNVTDMSYMFIRCSGLTSLNLSGWNTLNVTDMKNMFQDCSSLTSLDLSSFNTSNVTSMFCMFDHCSSLTKIYVGNSWSTAKVTSSSNMFYNCTKLPNFTSSVVDKTNAHTNSGGYLTKKTS